MSFVNVTIYGNVGGDPEMRYTPDGKPVTNFSVAHGKSKPDGQGGWIDEGTNWYRIAVWGERAERAAENIKKGDRVLVTGRLWMRPFEGRDGSQQFSLDVDADRCDKIIAKGEGGQGGERSSFTPPRNLPSGPSSTAQVAPPTSTTDLDDLPF